MSEFKMPNGNTSKQFGMRLRLVMRKKGISQEQLAKQVGTERENVRKWIEGNYYPTCENVIKVCKAMDVSMDFLMLGEVK